MNIKSAFIALAFLSGLVQFNCLANDKVNKLALNVKALWLVNTEDQLYIEWVKGYYTREQELIRNRIAGVKLKDGAYSFSINFNGVTDGYFRIVRLIGGELNSTLPLGVTPVYYFKSGDNVSICMVPLKNTDRYRRGFFRIQVDGHGCEKYHFKNGIDSVFQSCLEYYKSNKLTEKEGSQFEYSFSKTIAYTNRIVLSKDNRADWKFSRGAFVSEEYLAFTNKIVNKFKMQMADRLSFKMEDESGYRTLIGALEGMQPDNATGVFTVSASFIGALYNKVLMDEILSKGAVDFRSVYRQITRVHPNVLRDRLIASHFANEVSYVGRREDFVHAQQMVVEPYSAASLKKRQKGILGSGVEKYSFEDMNCKERYLKEFAGKKIILDFWFTGCAGCVSFHKDVLKPLKAHFKGDSSVSFLSINVDTDRDVWLKSLAQGIYSDAEAVNLYLNRQKMGNDIMDDYSIAAMPAILIIKYGKVMEFDTRFRNDISFFKEILSE